MQLAESVALVTGASGGIGIAISALLHRQGARLLVHGRGGPRLDAVAEQYDGEPLAVDFADPEGGQRLAAKALAVHGRVDVVVHCAGVGHYGPFADLGEVQLDRLLDVNLRAPAQLTRALLPHMVSGRRAHIAFVGSIAGLAGVAHEAAYSCTKFGITGLVESLTLELADRGVGVSLVCPGPVDTGFCSARGVPYARRVPRPIAPSRVALLLLRDITRDGGRHVVPRWLGIAPALQALAPRAYLPLARRFG